MFFFFFKGVQHSNLLFSKSYVLGDPSDQETTLGPMANIKFAENVRHHIKDAIEKGATPLIDTKSVFPKDKVSLN